jgi:aryl-alcohol dehydrogenase-like predicted oxidoreductase
MTLSVNWPNRTSPHFGNQWPNNIRYDELNASEQIEQMLDILHGLAECVAAGKIRHCGLSDETPWGINQYLRLSEKHNLPRMVSIQNEFSLLHSKDWPYLIENCVHENIAYLPWSPLATGLLSGKYHNGARPAGSRWTFMQRNGLYRDTKQSNLAVAAYNELAKKQGISPITLALAWCDQINGVTSTIIGATKMSQLKENVAAFETPLSEELLAEVTQILKHFPMPY